VTETIRGVAGSHFKVGQILALGDDGKYHLAVKQPFAGVAAERIEKGQEIIRDSDGNWRPTYRLTDAQLAAGVEALRAIRKKFNGSETDGAIVYAIYFAVVEAARS
jgi:hypothetical protein